MVHDSSGWLAEANATPPFAGAPVRTRGWRNPPFSVGCHKPSSAGSSPKVGPGACTLITELI